MLARWAGSRSFSHSSLQWNALISTSRRTFSSSVPPRSYLLSQPRPSTWSARIWYRKDGTPRSKVKGLVIGSFTALFLAVFLAAGEIVDDLETANLILRQLAHIQRMDTEFSSLDVNDLNAVVYYFLSSFRAAERISTDVFDAFLTTANALTGEKREELHTIVREAIEEVHQTLIDSKGRDPLATGIDALDCLSEALMSAADIIILYHGSEDNYYVRMVKTQIAAEGMTSKDRVSKGGEYEVVG